MIENLKNITITAILIVFLFIGGFFVFILLRRFYHHQIFKRLDKLRNFYRDQLNKIMNFNEFPTINLKLSPGSLNWQALQDVLIEQLEDKKNIEKIKSLFNEFGYVTYYEERLKSKSAINKCNAIDKLGKMQAVLSTEKLIPLLKEKNPEVVSTTIIALSRIKTVDALRGILENLPYMYSNWLATRKTIISTLITFDSQFLPIFLEYASKYYDNSKILALIMDVLSNYKEEKLIALSMDKLFHADAEIRAKALKIIESNIEHLKIEDIRKLLVLVKDPSWFVRLRLTRVLERTSYEEVLTALEVLLFDPIWQVRDAAANALMNFKDSAFNLIIKVLTSSDIYAKESIYEAIQKNNYISEIEESLKKENLDLKEKSKKILDLLYKIRLH
jgi:HEAT repeat protein